MGAPKLLGLSCLSIGMLLAVAAGAQSFGAAKEKVVLQRKLPALTHLNGVTVKVKVTGHDDQSDLAHDLQALLETELLKDDSHLRSDETNASSVITCQITDYSHPRPTVTSRPSLSVSKSIKGMQKNQSYTRVTGSLSLSFQAKASSGQMIISDNVTAKYDEEFDSSGTDSSHGIMGSMTGSLKRVTGQGSSEQLNPPTDAELRSRLMEEVVNQIASHVVNTDEKVDVFLAKQKGALEDGDKEAVAGLWERALETFETAPPLTKPDDEAYRLYNIGVAYEALAYKAEDPKSAMKFLDQASINYGKAIDAKPSEKYFLDPQQRIEIAIVHYKKLESEKSAQAEAEAAAEKAKAPEPASNPARASAPAPVAKASGPRGLTNAQVIAMVKAGMDDDTVAQAVRASKAANFDLSDAGQQDLTTNGVSATIVKAMKARMIRKTTAAAR